MKLSLAQDVCSFCSTLNEQLSMLHSCYCKGAWKQQAANRLLCKTRSTPQQQVLHEQMRVISTDDL